MPQRQAPPRALALRNSRPGLSRARVLWVSLPGGLPSRLRAFLSLPRHGLLARPVPAHTPLAWPLLPGLHPVTARSRAHAHGPAACPDNTPKSCVASSPGAGEGKRKLGLSIPWRPSSRNSRLCLGRGRGRQGSLGHPDAPPAPAFWSQPSPCRQPRSARYTTNRQNKERPWGLEDSPGREAAHRNPLRADGRAA